MQLDSNHAVICSILCLLLHSMVATSGRMPCRDEMPLTTARRRTSSEAALMACTGRSRAGTDEISVYEKNNCRCSETESA